MKDTFRFSRFALLLRKHLHEEYKQYLLQAAGVFGVLFILSLLTTLDSINSQYNSKTHELLFFFGFVFGGSLFASLTYQSFQNTAKGIRFLQLPASSLEKILVMFVVCQLLFIVAFISLFYANDWIMCSIYNTFSKTPAGIPAERLRFFHADLFDMHTGLAKEGIMLFLVFSAIMHFGSLVFHKLSFIKAGLFIISFGGLVYWLNYVWMKGMIPEPNMPGGKYYTEAIRLGEDDNTRFVLLPDLWKDSIKWILPGVLYISFWIGSYFRLREKQI